MRKYIIQSDTFECSFLFVVSPIKEFINFINNAQSKHIYSLEDHIDDYGCYVNLKDPLKHYNVNRIVWISKFRKGNIEDMGTLVHELQHLVLTVLIYRGLKLSRDSDEAFTYLLESVFKKCLKVLK